MSSKRPAPRRPHSVRQTLRPKARSACLVAIRRAVAESLRQCRLVDGGTEFVFQGGYVFVVDFLALLTLYRVLDAFGIGRIGVEFRRGHVGDAEHDPVARLIAFGGAESVLGGT